MPTFSEQIHLKQTERVNERRFVGVFTLAAFTHVIGDPLTTWLAHTYAGGYELNPLLRPALNTGPLAFAVMHIPIVLVTVFCGVGLVYCLRRISPPWNRRLARLGEFGFGLATLWGLGLMVNNLAIFL